MAKLPQKLIRQRELKLCQLKKSIYMMMWGGLAEMQIDPYKNMEQIANERTDQIMRKVTDTMILP